ncbi:hypothetical protein [Dechloromonas sp. A34]|uniref:hypothetical protein n=1 Tax=Dechloromonas sp. A34 TaxID=447588 RepID=UPI002248D70D|nr:hypothetical protein [Dechloromonas sp. A34]
MSLIVTLRVPVILAMIVLAGCATPERAPELVPPPPVAASTWRQVDSDIGAGSRAATSAARSFAYSQMENWKQLASQRAEADFIPWFSSYWTQQWLTAKVAWYNLSSGDTTDPPVNRLAAYLQEQYHDRVLAPVAEEVDPETIRAQATKLYIRHLSEQVQPIAQRYGVPQDQFERRLQDIPAIALAPPAAHNASLYQIVYSEPIDNLPAYAALLRQAREAAANAGAGLSKKRISPVAKQVSEKLMDRLAISGGASAASALVGGIAGTVISLGAAGIGVMLHEAGRAEIESQLRETLNAAMDDMWHILMDDPNTGMMAGIYYLSEQIEKSTPQTFTQPVEPARQALETLLPDESPAQEQTGNDEAPDENGAGKE